jgi:transposase-like protein
MALDQSALTELLDALRSGGDLDFMREAMQLVLQALIDMEATQHIGAGPYDAQRHRTTHRNGSRSRPLSTKAGDVELAIPKLRHGSFFPALLEPRRRIDRALWAVIMEAFVHGVSTRKVDDLVAALGIDTGVSKSQVSRICTELDTAVSAFRDRRSDHIGFPYVFFDATYVKAHDGTHVVSKAIVVATGVADDGNREVLGLSVGHSEDKAFWTAFLRSLRARGLGGVRLVISDAHEGPRASIDRVMLGASWQRCRVHFLRNVLAKLPKGTAEMVAAAIRTVFAQPDAVGVADQLDSIAEKLGRQFPRGGDDAARGRCRHLRLRRLSRRPLEEDLEHESARAGEQGDQAAHQRRRGSFPTRPPCCDFAGSVLLEVHDEWQVSERRYLSEGSMAKLHEMDND